jgi:hypothetical protein
VASCRVSTEYKNDQYYNERKRAQNCHAKQFKLKYDLLKMSTNSQTEFAATTHLAVGQWVEEQLNVEKFRMF